jgi:hypothetical protein
VSNTSNTSLVSNAANTINITNDASTAVLYPILSANTSGYTNARVTSGKLTFNAATGTLTSTSFYSTSDETLKDNFNTIDDALSILDKLEALSFTWKDTGDKSYGFKAQDVEKIIPEIVGESNGHKTISYIQLVPILVQAIKELKEQIKK